MLYDCLFYNANFVIAKLHGWQWSPAEKQPPFSLHESPEMHEAETDYRVEVSGQLLWASQIDPALIGGE